MHGRCSALDFLAVLRLRTILPVRFPDGKPHKKGVSWQGLPGLDALPFNGGLVGWQWRHYGAVTVEARGNCR
jgi:hypothetical protein